MADDVRSARPLFIDTGAFLAWYDDNDEHHEESKSVFQAIRTGDLPYRPLYTSRSVFSELATRLQRTSGISHDEVVDALHLIRESPSFNIEPIDTRTFDEAYEKFSRYDDQEISFVDHTTGVLASEHCIERIFGFDSDFQTLGFTVVPEDTGEP